MYFSSSILTILFAGAGLVSAHGQIKSVTIGGKTYPGATGAGADPSNSPVRAITNGDPIDDVNSDMMICGRNAKNAPISAAVSPGDVVEIAWEAEGGPQPWFHNVGPVQTYMAACNGDCKDYTPSASTKWFKISELGLKSDGTWYQADMNNGSPLPVTIPAALPGGNYLLRHEILALQNGMTKDLAEFYPNCVQMTVSGGNTINANNMPSPTVSFPGAYKDTDPGILVNVYNPGLNYVFPGPQLASIVKGTSGGDPNPSEPPAPSNTKAPVNTAPTPSSTNSHAAPAPSSTGKNTCRLRGQKKNQKRALRMHAKRRMFEGSY